MIEYVPFLKYKVNEIAALRALNDEDIERISPFFDLPRKDNLNSEDLRLMVDRAYRKYEINLGRLPLFYIDNFDIDDRILINNSDSYLYILEKFSAANVIPVIGIDRSFERNTAVVIAKNNDVLNSDVVALRVTPEDFLSFTLVEDDIDELFETLDSKFSQFHLIIDNRVCFNVDAEERASQVIRFINEISDVYDFEKIIVTGSSIPASIRDILEPNNTVTIDRKEIDIFNRASIEIPEILLGDYTAVSPNYSDVSIQGELMRRVTAPKIIYSFDNQLHIKRGGAIEGHPRGNKQYNDLSLELIREPFYRGAAYSFGDNYINERANDFEPDATPSTMPKPLINAHITFMLNDFA